MDIAMAALAQAGYDPYGQLSEYVRTGSLTYIACKNNIRQLVASLDKAEVKAYIREEEMT